MLVWDWVGPRACTSLRAWVIDAWRDYVANPNRSVALHGVEQGVRLLGLEISDLSIRQGYLP